MTGRIERNILQGTFRKFFFELALTIDSIERNYPEYQKKRAS